jgi:hypothetical protein
MCIILITGPFSAWHRGIEAGQRRASRPMRHDTIEVKTVCRSVGLLELGIGALTPAAAADIGL